jgi:uncharacterized protein YdhG (YjbR/CyaY superfamily)
MEMPADVVAYIEAVDPEHRKLFDELHELILETIPEAEVRISYQIPLYEAGKLHVGLNARAAGLVTLTTTSPDHIAGFKAKYPALKTGKASIQFRFGDELPRDGISDVIRQATSAP